MGPRPGAGDEARARARPGLTLDDVDLFELNEPFAFRC
jgi:hypothetical protein